MCFWSAATQPDQKSGRYGNVHFKFALGAQDRCGCTVGRAPRRFLSFGRGAPIFRRDILSDMHTARRAGGNNTAFTLAVLFVILLVIVGFVWRTLEGEPDQQPVPVTQGKGNG